MRARSAETEVKHLRRILRHAVEAMQLAVDTYNPPPVGAGILLRWSIRVANDHLQPKRRQPAERKKGKR